MKSRRPANSDVRRYEASSQNDKHMIINYDQVLINGDEEVLWRYSANTDHCIVVDWREEDDAIVKYVADKLGGDELSAHFTDEGLEVIYRGIAHKLPLTFSLKDRYITLRGLNEILKDKYEIRVFNNSFGSDTHSFYVKPKVWWEYMENHFPERMQDVFSAIGPDMDFH